jgi:signal transduction histidine kinase
VLIADPGPGIPAEKLSRVFDAFTGTKPQRGTGLGLWVARSTVTKHGGTIRIRAGQGSRSGTVVSVFLPARSRGKAPKSAKALASHAAKLG